MDTEHYLAEVLTVLVERSFLVDTALVREDGAGGTVLFALPRAAGEGRLPVSASWDARTGWTVCAAYPGSRGRKVFRSRSPRPAPAEVAELVGRSTRIGWWRRGR